MSKQEVYRFRLYVAGEAQNSAQALANLTAICHASIPDQHTIEVVDVFKEPLGTLNDGVFMTPTLVKLEPAPTRRIVGTLSEAGAVVQALGLAIPVL